MQEEKVSPESLQINGKLDFDLIDIFRLPHDIILCSRDLISYIDNNKEGNKEKIRKESLSHKKGRVSCTKEDYLPR